LEKKCQHNIAVTVTTASGGLAIEVSGSTAAGLGVTGVVKTAYGATVAANATKNFAKTKSKYSSSKYDDVTTSSRGKKAVTNKKTNVTKTEFENNLEKSGFKKNTSKDGNATTLTKDNRSYIIRNNGTGKPTADFKNNKNSKKSRY